MRGIAKEMATLKMVMINYVYEMKVRESEY